jgi:hypothetical protein
MSINIWRVYKTHQFSKVATLRERERERESHGVAIYGLPWDMDVSIYRNQKSTQLCMVSTLFIDPYTKI